MHPRLLPSLLLAPLVAAQDPARVIGDTVERQLRMEVETRLRSDKLETVAWGAWLASEHRVTTAVPALREALAKLGPMGPAKFAAQAVLDALAQNGAKVSPELLAPFTGGMHEGVAFVLMAREPKAHQDELRRRFLALDKMGRYSRWMAAGNLLAACKDRGFGRHLLAGLRHDVVITVYDGDSIGGAFGGAAGGKHVDRGFRMPPHYPPAVTYRLVTRPVAGDVLFAPGAKPVFYRREVHAGDKVPNGKGERLVIRGRQEVRVGWIRQAASGGVPELSREEVVWHHWQDLDAYRAEVAKQQKRLAWSRGLIEAAALELEWIEPEERQRFRLRTALSARDHRDDRATPLPPIK